MPERKKAGSKPDTGMAFVATFFSIIGFVIAVLAKRKDKYVMYYAKQSLVLFILIAVVSIAGNIPFIGGVISVVGGVSVFVLWVFQWAYALSGDRKHTPIIGGFGEKIKL